METFGSPLLESVQFNPDGSLKKSGKQQAKFYHKRVLDFRAIPLKDENGEPKRDEKGKILFDIDPKTGLPRKEAYEKTVEMIRVETKGDTNVKDDVADDVAKRQFSREYLYFKQGKMPDGHPIEDFSFIQPQTVMELKFFGIHVMEQVAEMEDLQCQQLTSQPGFELRDIAKQWVDINSPQSVANRASKAEIELERANARIKELERGAGKTARKVLPVEPQIAETPAVQTMEISAEDLKNGKRKRMVS